MTRQEYMAGLLDAIERGQAGEYRAAFPWPPGEPEIEPEALVPDQPPPVSPRPTKTSRR